mgnify:CR=1 FL=1
MRPKLNESIADEQPFLRPEFKGLLHIDYQDALQTCYGDQINTETLSSNFFSKAPSHS